MKLTTQEAGLHDVGAMEELEDVLPIQPSLSAPTKREFKPWHRPRKQFIRRKQWCVEIDRLIRNTDFPPDNRVLRYLTLPSEDMLDIRVVESILERKSLKLKYLGFCNLRKGGADDTRMSISEAEVKSLKSIDDTSLVVRDMLEATGNRSSHAYKELDKHAPYHVINIDLCSHFAAPRQAGTNSCIDAIKSISGIQVLKSRGSWLLFLTTRIQKDHIDHNHLIAFIKAIQMNVDSSEDFKTRLGISFQGEAERLLDTLKQWSLTAKNPEPDQCIGEISTEDFRKFFCIGLGKWLLSFLTNATPKTDVELLKSYFYTIDPEDNDMLSLAFRCTPQLREPVDKLGLLNDADEQAALADEVDLGIKLLERTEELVNLDLLLAENVEIHQKMAEDSKNLLAAANYDVSDYPACLDKLKSQGNLLSA